MSKALKISSRAKLNLTFEILGNLPGGYHDVRTVFQSIDLADQLHFTLTDSASPKNQETLSVSLSSERELSDFPMNDENLIVRAANSFAELNDVGKGKHLHIHIDKRIPIAAGLAGGSSNAAATITAMQELFVGLPDGGQAETIASKLGSDINFCLRGGTQLGTGRGD